MKKRCLPLILCISLLISALLSVVSYADEQTNTLQPIYLETFDDVSKYTATDKYNATVADGVLTIQAKNDTHRDIYKLSSDQDVLNSKTKLTFAVNFKLDTLHTSGSMFASFGHSENKAYIAGFQRLNGYAYLVHGTAVETETKGTLTTTQRLIVTPFPDGSASSNQTEFPATDIITMVVEVDSNSSTICTMYANGTKVGVAGELRAGEKYQKYNAAEDADKTMNGHFGMCIPTAQTTMKLGTYAIYDGIGLDHDAIMQQVYNVADFEAAADTDNTNPPDTGDTNTQPNTDTTDTQPDTDKVNDNTENNTQNTTLETEEAEKAGGCSSSLGITAVAVVGALGFVGVTIRKKEHR